MSSTKKSIGQKRMDKERQDNRALTRIYYVFLLGLAAECYLFLVYRGYSWGTVNSVLAWHKVLTAGIWLGLAALAVGLAVGVWKRRDRRLRAAMTWVGGAGAFFCVSGWVITRFFANSRGVIAMCILVPILAVLALIYLLYQHECALCTALLAGAMFSVWLRGASADSMYWSAPVRAGCLLAAAGLLALTWLAWQARKNGGKLRGVRVFSVECDYRIVCAVILAAAAAMLLAAFLPGSGYYLLWALGVLLFAELAYYTTKLM